MKLSDMNGKQGLAALATLAPSIGAIARDDDAIKCFFKIGKAKTRLNQISIMTDELVPLVLVKHEGELFSILSYLSEKTIKELEEESAMQLFADAKEYLFDAKLLDFFKSAASTKPKK